MCVTADATVLPRGTPLYGQPSWWGDGDADDENSFKQESKSTKKQDGSLSGRPTNGSESELVECANRDGVSVSVSPCE